MDSSLTFEAGRLRLELTWRADRFAHSIGVTAGRCFLPLLESVEGASDLSWPPSPPVQHIESGPQGAGGQIMCVGMAGRCHWSAAIQLLASSQSALFDVACRVKYAPPTGVGIALGSRYRTRTAPVTESARTLRVDADGAGLLIESLPPSSDTAAAEVFRTDTEIHLVPPANIDQTPYTIRWRYSVSVV